MGSAARGIGIASVRPGLGDGWKSCVGGSGVAFDGRVSLPPTVSIGSAEPGLLCRALQGNGGIERLVGRFGLSNDNAGVGKGVSSSSSEQRSIISASGGAGALVRGVF